MGICRMGICRLTVSGVDSRLNLKILLNTLYFHALPPTCRDKKCWNCGSEALSKGYQDNFFYTSTQFNQHLICPDLLNDEDLRLGVEKFQRGEWTSEEKTGEQELIKSAGDEIKAKAAKKAALKRELPGSEDNGTSAKKSNLIEVPTLFI